MNVWPPEMELMLEVRIVTAFGAEAGERVLAVANKLPCGKELRLVEFLCCLQPIGGGCDSLCWNRAAKTAVRSYGAICYGLWLLRRTLRQLIGKSHNGGYVAKGLAWNCRNLLMAERLREVHCGVARP